MLEGQQIASQTIRVSSDREDGQGEPDLILAVAGTSQKPRSSDLLVQPTLSQFKCCDVQINIHVGSSGFSLYRACTSRWRGAQARITYITVAPEINW